MAGRSARNSSASRAVAHVRAIPAGPIWSCSPRPRSGRPGPHRPGAGNSGASGAGQAASPSVSLLGQRPEVLRFAGCGQATRRLRPGDRPCGPPGRRGRAPAAGAPGRARPLAAGQPAMRGSWQVRPRTPRASDFRGVIARLLPIRACKGLQRFMNATPRSPRYPAGHSIRMKTALPRDLPPSRGITGTPWAPRIGRARRRGRAARARSARCRPARAGPPAPRLRRARGTAGRPGRTGP